MDNRKHSDTKFKIKDLEKTTLTTNLIFAELGRVLLYDGIYREVQKNSLPSLNCHTQNKKPDTITILTQ